MQTNSSFYWSRPSSADQSCVNNYQTEQVSISKSRQSLFDFKVSPRIHKLSDPQRSNLPAQAYLRLDIRLPSSKSIRPYPLDSAHDTGKLSTAVTSAITTAVNTPVTRQGITLNHKSHGVLPQYIATTSSKIKFHSRHESLKSINEMSPHKEEHRILEERRLSRESNKGIKDYMDVEMDGLPKGKTPEKIITKELSPRISPYNNCRRVKTHLLDESGKSARKLTSQRQMTEMKENERSGQQLTFRTHTGTRIDTEGQSKQDEGEDMGCESYGGFTTFRGYLEKGSIQETVRSSNKGSLFNVIEESQTGIKKKLNFEASEETNRGISQRGKIVTGRENKFEELLRNKDRKETDRSEGIKSKNTRREEIRGWSHSEVKVACNTSYDKEKSVEKMCHSKRRQKSLHEMYKEKENDGDDLLTVLYGEMKSPTITEMNEARERSVKKSTRKDDAEMIKLKKMMMELQKKTLEKDMEILNLQKENKAGETEAREINARVSLNMTATKKSVDKLEQMTQHLACQEREITFLNKCKERLESILPSPDDHGMDIYTYLQKVKEYENILVDKEKEAQEICAKIVEFENEGKAKIEAERTKGRVEVRRVELEIRVRDQEIKHLNEAIEEISKKLNKCSSVEEKMILLESTQNQLIEENERLKNQLPLEARRKFEKILQEKALTSKLLTIFNEIHGADDYSKNIIKILEAILKGNDYLLDINKLSNCLNKEKRKLIKKNMFKNLSLKELSQSNADISEKLHQRLTMCMDDICEEYARNCGRNCNVQ